MAVTENKFTEFAVGLGVDAGALAGLDRQILVQGSFAQGSENAFLKRKTSRIVAGLTADVWGPVGFLGGFQQYKKEFGVPAYLVTEASERLIMAGLRVKIAPLSYVSVQFAQLKNELQYNNGVGISKISIDKNVILGDVTVNF